MVSLMSGDFNAAAMHNLGGACYDRKLLAMPDGAQSAFMGNANTLSFAAAYTLGSLICANILENGRAMREVDWHRE